jgi:XTP/dITP diphosphohydrolase
MTTDCTLVLGTHNRKKGRELSRLLEPFGFDLRTLADFPDAIEPVEDGHTFEENAAIKATQQARHLHRWVIGEDSGLEVQALEGEPGIYSARYAGPDADDPTNNQLLLDRLRDVPTTRRSARYVCHITLADPEGNVRAECEASCRGRIALQPSGTSGFGYDPLFLIPEYHQTFAELGETVKSVISHRSRATRLIVPKILALKPQIEAGRDGS